MGGRRNDSMCFWRDVELPYIEARVTRDGRGVHYAKHSHDTFSIGAIIGGHSDYWHKEAAIPVSRGAIVVMNPHEIHACNPRDEFPWSYAMLYVEPAWLAGLQRRLGCDADGDFRPFATRISHDPAMHRGLTALSATLLDPGQTTPVREARTRAFFTQALQRLMLAAAQQARLA